MWMWYVLVSHGGSKQVAHLRPEDELEVGSSDLYRCVEELRTSSDGEVPIKRVLGDLYSAKHHTKQQFEKPSSETGLDYVILPSKIQFVSPFRIKKMTIESRALYRILMFGEDVQVTRMTSWSKSTVAYTRDGLVMKDQERDRKSILSK